MNRFALIVSLLSAASPASALAAALTPTPAAAQIITPQSPPDSIHISEDLPEFSAPPRSATGVHPIGLPSLSSSSFPSPFSPPPPQSSLSLPSSLSPPSLSSFSPAPIEFIMPGRDLFIAHDRFRRLEGITIPAASINRSQMITSSRGHMPLMSVGNHTLVLTGTRRNSPSLGFSNSITAGYVWAATDGITLYGNLRAGDNMFHLTRFKNFDISARARVRLTDGLWINGYGTYTIYNSAGGQPLPLGLYPTNSFGGTIEVRITDSFGLEGGVMREYDPFRRRWVTNPYIMPVFY